MQTFFINDATRDVIEILKDNWDNIPQNKATAWVMSTSTVECMALGYRYGDVYGAFKIISISESYNCTLIRMENAYTIVK